MTEEGELKVFQLGILLVCIGLLIGAVTRFVQKKTGAPIPYTVAVLVIGCVLAAIPTDSLGNLGACVSMVRNIDPHLLLGAFIPPLIFESAFATNYHIVAREFGQALLLAGPGVVINTGLTAVFCYYGFNYNWNWAQSILFGAMISATDPVAVVSLLRELGASKRLATLIEGESLLNDGTAFVLYKIALEFVQGHNPGLSGVTFSFLQLTFGGILTGLLFGVVCAWWLSNCFQDPKIEISLTIFSCYLCFYLAEEEFESSGVLSCVFLGLFLSKYKSTVSPAIEASLHHVWEIFSYSANTLIFLFSGIIIVYGIEFDDTIHFIDVAWLILLYFVLHITRIFTLALLWIPLKRLGYGISTAEGVIITFSGLRGVIALALAMLTRLQSLPFDESQLFKDRAMFHVCGVVFLTLIVNATVMKYIVKALGLDLPTTQAQLILRDAMNHLRDETRDEMRSLKNVYIYAGADWQQVVESLPNYTSVVGHIATLKSQSERQYTAHSLASYTTANSDPSHQSLTSVCDKLCSSLIGYCNGFCSTDSTREPTPRTPLDMDDFTPVVTNDNTHPSNDRRANRQKRFTDQRYQHKNQRQNSSDDSKYDSEGDTVGELKNLSKAATGDSLRNLSDADAKQKMRGTHTLSQIIGERFGIHSSKKRNKKDDRRNKNGPNVVDSHSSDKNTISSDAPHSVPIHKQNNEGPKRPSFVAHLSTLVAQNEIDEPIAMDEYGAYGVDDRDKRSQFSHRILSVMKSAYRASYEEGSISQQAQMVLTEAAEAALDYDDLNIHFEMVQKVFEIPWWLRQWYETNILKRLSRHLLFQQLSLAVEVGTVYIRSTKTVGTVLGSIKQLSETAICKEIIKTLDEEAEVIREEWLGIQRSYPEVYRAIQTRHAAQHMIHHEAHKIEELANEGLLEDEEFTKMMNKLLETQHQLRNKSFFNVTLTEKDQKSILQNLEFMNRINSKETYKMVSSSDKKLKQRNESIHIAGHKALGAIVIARGTAELKVDDEHRDTYAPGSFLAWEYLTGNYYLGDLLAQTTVEYFFLEDRTMKAVMAEPDAEEVIWKMVASNLVCAHFRDSFDSFSRLEISKMCHMSTFVKTGDNEEKALAVHTMLVKGEAMYPVGDNPTFRAPMVLLPSQIPYTFDKGSILLQFFIDPRKTAHRGPFATQQNGMIINRSNLHGIRRQPNLKRNATITRLNDNTSRPPTLKSLPLSARQLALDALQQEHLRAQHFSFDTPTNDTAFTVQAIPPRRSAASARASTRAADPTGVSDGEIFKYSHEQGSLRRVHEVAPLAFVDSNGVAHQISPIHSTKEIIITNTNTQTHSDPLQIDCSSDLFSDPNMFDYGCANNIDPDRIVKRLKTTALSQSQSQLYHNSNNGSTDDSSSSAFLSLTQIFARKVKHFFTKPNTTVTNPQIQKGSLYKSNRDIEKSSL